MGLAGGIVSQRHIFLASASLGPFLSRLCSGRLARSEHGRKDRLVATHGTAGGTKQKHRVIQCPG
jgi:hypothetical protein